jgi:hypothetical protein
MERYLSADGPPPIQGSFIARLRREERVHLNHGATMLAESTCLTLQINAPSWVYERVSRHEKDDPIVIFGLLRSDPNALLVRIDYNILESTSSLGMMQKRAEPREVLGGTRFYDGKSTDAVLFAMDMDVSADTVMAAIVHFIGKPDNQEISIHADGESIKIRYRKARPAYDPSYL